MVVLDESELAKRRLVLPTAFFCCTPYLKHNAFKLFITRLEAAPAFLQPRFQAGYAKKHLN
jgi:hypothetical protein